MGPIVQPHYTEEEHKVIDAFRIKVQDVLDTEQRREDSFLIRWLRARNMNISKAEEMLRASMKWRKENDIDTILEREQVPEELRKVSPMAWCGVSDDGYGVFIFPWGRYDNRAALEKYGLEACERFNTIYMELTQKMLNEASEKCGKRISQVIEIMDCEGYSYRQMSTKLSRDFMTRMQKQMDDNYPEFMQYFICVNAPKVFALLFQVMKPFIPKHTLEKIDIHGPILEKWKPIIRERFPFERIPKHWGGTLGGVDEFCSGDPIWIQGPADMKAFMNGLSEDDAGFTVVKINAREKVTKEFDIKERGTILEWKFKTEQNDIAFQLTLHYKTLQPQWNDIVPNIRVDADAHLQEGSHVCESLGKYVFTFDNSFSMVKSKTVLYQIGAFDPAEQMDDFKECVEFE